MENNKLSTGLTVWLWIIFVVNVLEHIVIKSWSRLVLISLRNCFYGKRSYFAFISL